FSAGILQDPLFSNDRPQYLNFPAIGNVIGHEIVHGFDDLGRQFDKNGNNINWWDQETDKSFRQKAQCIIDQYNNYTVGNGVKINGVHTLGENMADIGGMKVAYKAYQSWASDYGIEPSLPGLNYTPKQLFWISAANVMCSKFRPEFLMAFSTLGIGTPAMFRVIGPMSNLPEFAEDFGCSPDSSMVRENKCEVWKKIKPKFSNLKNRFY
ncbi:neprilysin-2-like, partial [Stegodyphus dumicola]|uniref:neprilysin-2-like n=1 Tax=Stegodyphus dumicola TaxID=202533 RepID=UPI0015ABA05A